MKVRLTDHKVRIRLIESDLTSLKSGAKSKSLVLPWLTTEILFSFALDADTTSVRPKNSILKDKIEFLISANESEFWAWWNSREIEWMVSPQPGLTVLIEKDVKPKKD
jgi:hypothetical protein